MNSEFGTRIDFDGGFVFFGNKRLSLENFATSLPGLNFVYLKQVHGVDLHEVTEANIKSGGISPALGDGLWTGVSNRALVVQSADCLPLIFYSALGIAGAVHAGWRGVAQNIAGVFAHQMRARGIPAESLRCWIGPHIQKSSFQVQEPVLRQLVRPDQSEFFTRGEGGFYVNLSKIVTTQLVAAGLRLKNIHLSNEDTVTNRDYHSYRAVQRLNQSLSVTERNLSFIVLNDKF